MTSWYKVGAPFRVASPIIMRRDNAEVLDPTHKGMWEDPVNNKKSNRLPTTLPLSNIVYVTQYDSYDSVVIMKSAWWLEMSWCLFGAGTSAAITTNIPKICVYQQYSLQITKLKSQWSNVWNGMHYWLSVRGSNQSGRFSTQRSNNAKVMMHLKKIDPKYCF